MTPSYRSKNFRSADGEWEWTRLQASWRSEPFTTQPCRAR